MEDVFRLRQKTRKKKEPKKGEKVKVDLIDGKRQTNLAIALNQFKRDGRAMEMSEIVDAIKNTELTAFGKNGIDFVVRVSLFCRHAEKQTCCMLRGYLHMLTAAWCRNGCSPCSRHQQR